MSDSVGSVSVDVVPDARGWSEKLRAQLRDQNVTVKADADVSAAEAKLDEVARTRTAKIKTDTDSGFDKGAKALDSFVSKLGLLPALAIAGSAALVPLAGALGGVAAALAAPLVIAGGGATLFGILAGFAVSDTNKQLKHIDELRTKLDGLTKGTQEYRDAQAELKSAQDALSPSQVAFSDSLGKLKGTFQEMIQGPAGQSLLEPFTRGMGLLSDLLPKVAPLLESVSGAFDTLLGGISRAASGPGFDRFMRIFANQAGSDIVGFGQTIGNIATGVGGLFQVLDRSVGHSLVDQLVRMTGAFSDWANSKAGRQAVHDFLDYFHQVGPQVADTVGAVARGFGHLVDALAPLGPPTLRVIQGIADAVSGIPTPVLTALLAGAAGGVAFGKLGGFKGAPGALRLGQNVLSGLTGGLIPGASKYGRGVTPVYVVNGGSLGLGDGVPGKKGLAGRAFDYAKKIVPPAAVAAGGAAVGATAVGAIAAGSAYGSYKYFQIAGAPGHVNAGGMTPEQWRQFNAERMRSMYPSAGIGTGLKAPSTQLDALKAKADAASRSLEAMGMKGSLAGENTARSIQRMNERIAGVPVKHIDGTANALDGMRTHAQSASRQLELIGPHAEDASGRAVHAIQRIPPALAAIHDKRIQIRADGVDAAISKLQALQAMTIRDKSFNVIQNNIERNVGPGGGMQRHATGGWVHGAGTATSDSVVMRASVGEYVVNAADAARNRAVLDQINYGHRSYASAGSGGMVHTTINLDGQRIGEALSPFMEQSADAVYHANAAYSTSVAGL